MVDLKTTLSAGADYDKWIKADLWTVERAILLLIDAESLPYWPDNYNTCSPITDDEKIIYSDFMDIWDIARASLKAGSLKKVDKSAAGLMRNEVRPNEFIHWARIKGYEIPDELKTIRAEPQAEPLADAGVVDDVEPETNPPLGKPNNNELALSGLLNEPANKDDWFEVIDEMTKEFYINNQNTMPSKVQARAALWKDSPKHGITVNGEDLKMIGVTKPLNPRSFNRRWNEYTNQIKPN